MPTFSVTFTVWFDAPATAPNPGMQLIGRHSATLPFECTCANAGPEPVPDVAPARDGVTIRLVGDPETPEPWVAAGPLDDVYLLAPRTYLRRANCTEGAGLLFFVVANGGYNPRVPNQPFTFLEYELSASWRICCCCDPDSGETSYSVTPHRGPKASVAEHAKGFVFEIEFDTKATCDDEAKPDLRRIDTRA